MELLETLRALCLCNGVSGWEDEVREELRRRAEPLADRVWTDALGNLMAFKKGKRSDAPSLMVTAHMDEVGMIVTHITEQGYLKFQFAGGVDRRVVLGKRVEVGPNRVPGVIGMKAIHLLTKQERKGVPKLDALYIDIGASDRAQAEALVSLGDFAAFHSDAVLFGEGMLKAKAVDDRVGCAVMLSLLEEELPMDVTFVFSIQEELGTRGAFGAAFRLHPDLALALEGTTAADFAGVPAHQQVCHCGKGPVVPYMDGGAIYDRELFCLLRELARERQIPWQTKEMISGGTDAQTIQRTKDGVRVAGISAPVRYLHTPSSVVSCADVVQIRALALAFIEAVAQGRA